MKGSVTQLRPGYWQARVSLGRDPLTGKPKYRTKAVRGTKREVEQVLARLLVEVNAGKLVQGGSSVQALIDQWLEHIESLGRSPTTMNSYRSLRDQLPAGFLAKPLRNVTPKMIDDLYLMLGSKKGRGASTVHHYHRLLRAAFNQGMKWQMLEMNPAKLATPPRVQQEEINPPTAEEVKRVVAMAGQFNPEAVLWFRMLIATGCRRAEVTGLRWSDVSLARKQLTIRGSVVEVGRELVEKGTKTHQQRKVTLDKHFVAALRTHHETVEENARIGGYEFNGDGFVFSDSPDGADPIPPNRISKAWQRYAKKAGVDARMHDLRHFQASILLDAGESITTVAARLGHRDTATTLRVYAHLMPGADDRAAEIMGDMWSS